MPLKEFKIMLTETINPKLIINRKRIINNLKNKIDYHKSMVDMYQQKSVSDSDFSAIKRSKVNIWRHNRQIKNLEDKLEKQMKILERLTESVNLLFEEDEYGYNQANQMTAPLKLSQVINMSFSSLFKPLNISGLNIKSRNRIMAEANVKLSRVNKLTAQLQKKAMDQNNKNAQMDKIQLKYCQAAYKLHHEFISKTLFWKSRSMIIMGPQFLQLKEQYTRALFNLEQDYKREELGLKTVDTRNY